MKAIRITIDLWINEVEQKWKKLPARKQNRYLIIGFVGYLMATLLGLIFSLI